MSKRTSDVLNSGRSFSWGELLSHFTDRKSEVQTQKALTAGNYGSIPYESEMIETWNYPFLFFKVLTGGLLLFALVFLCNYLFSFGSAMVLIVAPAVFPLTIMVLLWELNIPRNISLFKMIAIFLMGGVTCVLIASLASSVIVTRNTTLSSFLLSLMMEMCELLITAFLIRKKSRGYGINGLVIGAAVGAGVATFTTAEQISYIIAFNRIIPGIELLIIVRVLLTIGMDTLWGAAIGGALALSKKKETLKIRHFGDSLFIISFISCYLMKFLWGYNLLGFFWRFFDNDAMVTLYKILEIYNGKKILLIIIAWAFTLFIARKCIMQTVTIADKAMVQKHKWDAKVAGAIGKRLEITGISGPYLGQKFDTKADRIAFGRSSANNIVFAGNAKGISSNHCDIQKKGQDFVLTDMGSTYGTFVGNGRKLNPGESYVLKNGDTFYLAAPEYSFSVVLHESKAEDLQAQNFDHRTNEVDGVEESSAAFLILAIAILAFLFVALYATNAYYDTDYWFEEEEIEEDSVVGRWTSESVFPIKEMILENIDNIITIADIAVFKQNYADGILFTADGDAYMTYEGNTIDYAHFTYEIIDDETLLLKWAYEGIDATVSFAGISAEIDTDEEAGFTVPYELDGENLNLYIDGYSWDLTR